MLDNVLQVRFTYRQNVDIQHFGRQPFAWFCESSYVKCGNFNRRLVVTEFDVVHFITCRDPRRYKPHVLEKIHGWYWNFAWRKMHKFDTNELNAHRNSGQVFYHSTWANPNLQRCLPSTHCNYGSEKGRDFVPC